MRQKARGAIMAAAGERWMTPMPIGVAAAVLMLTIGAVEVSVQARAEARRQVDAATFERISITVDESGGERGFCCRLEPGGRLIAANATLRQLIQTAHMRHAFDRREVEGGPDWLDSVRFDVVADGAGEHVIDPDGVPRRTWAMLQRALVDRFRLSLRIESRPRDVYVLALARSDAQLGPRLSRSDVDCAAIMAMEIVGRRPQQPTCATTSYPGRLVASAVTLPTLGTLLSAIVNRPVVDRTGLSGVFDLDLEAVEIRPPGPFGPSLRPSDTTMSIFETLPAQLGLTLEPVRGTVEVLVIDHAEQPTS